MIILGRLPSSIESTEERLAAVKDAIDCPEVISGFTLFQVKDGWQMSIRPLDETGWKVQIIPEAQARRILLALENDKRFSDGTMVGQTIANMMSARPVRMDALITANKAAREALTAALRAWRP